MPDAIQTTSNSQQLAQADLANVRQRPEQGLFRGELVVEAASHQSILQDAAEEIATFHGERTSKDLAKRKTTDRNGRAAELAAKFIQKVPDVGQPERFHQLADSLKKLGAQATLTQLKQALQQQFGDVSHQYVALQFLDELLSESGEAPELLGLARQLRQELDAEQGAEIRAGLNITGVAISYERLDGPQNLRDFYRETILTFDDLSVAHESILQRYGEQHFDEAADFLIHAIGQDLSAEGPSIDPRKLKATLDNLYMVQVSRYAHTQFDELLAKTGQGFSFTPQTSSADLLAELLPLKDQSWVDAGKIQAIVNRLGTSDLEPQIYFLQGMANIVGGLPEKVFQSPHDRERLREAVQGALDQNIEAEGL